MTNPDKQDPADQSRKDNNSKNVPVRTDTPQPRGGFWAQSVCSDMEERREIFDRARQLSHDF